MRTSLTNSAKQTLLSPSPSRSRLLTHSLNSICLFVAKYIRPSTLKKNVCRRFAYGVYEWIMSYFYDDPIFWIQLDKCAFKTLTRNAIIAQISCYIDSFNVNCCCRTLNSIYKYANTLINNNTICEYNVRTLMVPDVGPFLINICKIPERKKRNRNLRISQNLYGNVLCDI